LEILDKYWLIFQYCNCLHCHCNSFKFKLYLVFMKYFIKTISTLIVVALGIISFGNFAFADYTQTITYTTSGSFIVPLGVTSLNASLTAGGGGGGGGGAGSSISNIIIPVTPGQVISYTVGTGGVAGATGSYSTGAGNGGNGGNTIFGTSTVLGGNGGQGAIVGLGNGIGGLAGGIGGTNGTDGASNYGERTYGGNGGTTPFGTGGNGGTGNAGTYTLPIAGTNGNGGGAGSGWAYYANPTYRDAGARGGDGLITFTLYADLTAPVITINGSSTVTIAANSVYTDLGATAIDNIDGDITANIITTGLPINTNATGTFAVVYTVSDSAGNTASSTRTVIVTDQTAPVLAVPGTQIFEATGATTTPALVMATAFDNIDPNPIITYDPSSFAVGTSTVIWTGTDSSGNFSTSSSLVVIVDTTGPTIVLNGSSTVSLMIGTPYVELGANATDLVDGTTTVNILGSVNTNATGTYFVIYQSTDSHGNLSQIIRTVNITPDTIAPVITAPIDQIFEATGATTTPVLVPATSTDNFTINPIITYAPSDFDLGTTTVVWTATDAAGNFSTTTSLVTIVDTTAPVITLNGSSTINILVGGTYTELGASSTDLVDGDVPVTATGTVDTFATGTYNVLYTATDSHSNIATSSRTINVTDIPDSTAPVITIFGSNPLTLVASGTATYTDAGATAFDNIDGTTTVSTIFNNVNPAIVGNYSVIYSATDLSLNTATSSRTVNVVAPILTTIIISPTSPTVMVGTSTQFIATTLDQVGDPIVATVFWGSSSTTVGTIGFNTGLFNGLAEGTTTIEAISGSVSASTTVTVSTVPAALTSISIAPLNPSLNVGGTTTFISTTLDQYGNPFATTTAWDSSSTTVGTIDSGGIFTAVAAGTTTVTGTAGSLSTSTLVTISILDITSPTIPTISSASATGTIILLANISWTDSTDAGSGLKDYLYLFDNTAGTIVSTTTAGIATTTSTSTSYSTAGTFWFHVAAIDNDGNISGTTSYGPFIISDSAVLYRNSTIGITFYTLFSPTIAESVIASTTGTTTITNSTLSTFWNVNNSTITMTSVDDVNLDATVVTNSTLINSDIARCTILNSLVKNYYLRDCYVAFSTLDPSSGLNYFVDSTSTNSQIYVSDIYYSDVDHSYVSTSTISSSDINYSTSTDSTIATSTISDGSVIDNSDVASSTLSDVTLASSTIDNSTITGADFINATVVDDIMSTGTIIANGTTTVISTPTPLANFINYAPVASFGTSTAGLLVTITDNSTDTNEGTPFADSWTYSWNFGDGSTSTIATSSVNGSTSHTYATSGSYIISLTLDDAHGGSSAASTSVTVSSATPVLTTISISPLTPTIVVGATTTFISTTLDQIGNPFATTTAWDSSSTTIGTIDSAGLFTALSAGTTTITGTAGSLSTSTVVTVSAVPAVLTSISMSPLNPSVTVGATTTFTGTPRDQYGNPFATTTTWGSSSTTIGTINSSGVFTAVSVGTTTVTATAGAFSTSTTVTVTSGDSIPPVITILGLNPVSVIVNTSYTDAGATAFDAYDGTSTAVTATGTVNINAVGTYTITYTSSDATGNTASSSRTVNVVLTADVTAPVITILGSNPANITTGGVYTDAGATALDNIDGDITGSILTTGLPINTSATGTFQVVYSVSDSAGNPASSTRIVNVIEAPVDTVSPVITITGGTPITITVGSSYTDQGATAFDNIDGTTTVSVSGLPINTSATGTYSVVYSSTDAALNTATATRTVNVIAAPADLIPPVITITGGTPTTVLASSTYTDQGATAVDNIDGDVTSSIVATGTVDTNILGTYFIIYTATDAALNNSTATRTVNVVEATSTDNIPPVITITGGTPITITVGSSYTDQGATAVDNIDGPIAATTTDTVNTFVIGVYTITYTATDAAFNVATATRIVNVIAAPADLIPPVITITGGTPITVLASSTYTDLGATSYDAFDNATTTLVGVSNVDTNIIGTYTVVYTATDIALNNSTATRTVNVIEKDSIPPIITILGFNPMTIIRTLPYVEPGAIAMDGFDGARPVIITGTVDVNATGTYLITYTSTDTSGNSASSTRTVNVIPDNIAPVITILGSNPASLTVGGTYTDAGATAVDNVDGSVAVFATGTVDTNMVGAYTITYTATDIAFNVATATRIVNVNAVIVYPSNQGTGVEVIPIIPDTATTTATSTELVATTTATTTLDKVAPVITIIGSSPTFVIVGETYVEYGAIAIDDIDGDITGSIKTEGVVDTSIVRSYQITYSVTDKAGNKASEKRIVVVNPKRSTETATTTEVVPDTGIEIPSGVGELNPINGNGGEVSSTTSTSSVATTTENNGLVATVLEGFANIPNKPIIVLMLVALASGVGLFFFGGTTGINIPKPPKTPNFTGSF
jgi:hypothetical protein